MSDGSRRRTLARLMDLLRPFDSEQLKAWKVSAEVGNVKNDRPDLIDVQPESKIPPREPQSFPLVDEYSRKGLFLDCSGGVRLLKLDSSR